MWFKAKSTKNHRLKGYITNEYVYKINATL